MNIVPDITMGWQWSLLINNLAALMFYAMMIVFVATAIAGQGASKKLLGVGLAFGTLGLIGVVTGWQFGTFWVVILTIGFIVTVVAGIWNAIPVHRR